MSTRPSLLESKTICRPSGNQRGEPERASNEVSCTGLEPSLLHIQTSLFPERSEGNTTFEPSGEYCGSPSGYVEAISFTAGLFLPGPDISARQMSASYLQ